MAADANHEKGPASPSIQHRTEASRAINSGCRSNPSLFSRFLSCMGPPKVEDAKTTRQVQVGAASCSHSSSTVNILSPSVGHGGYKYGNGSSTEELLERVFHYLDENRDGKISARELRNGMGEDLSTEEAERAVRLTDSDGDGQLGLEDFLKLVEAEEEQARAQSLRDAFRMYDMEGNGFITPMSLRRMLKRLGDDRSLHDCALMIRRFDLNGDGVLSFDEFQTMMVV